MQLSESIHTILSYEGVDEQRISTITRFILSYLDETQRRGFVISHSEKMEFNHNLRKLLIENKVPNAKNVIDQINSLISTRDRNFSRCLGIWPKILTDGK